MKMAVVTSMVVKFTLNAASKVVIISVRTLEPDHHIDSFLRVAHVLKTILGDMEQIHILWRNHLELFSSALHNVYFAQYVFLPTEQAETYLKICVLIYHST